MKRYVLTVCLLATLSGTSQAQSVASPEAPASPPAAPQPPQVRAQRTEFQELQDEIRQADPSGRLTSDQLYHLLQDRASHRAGIRFDPIPVVIFCSLSGCLLTGFLAWLLVSFLKTRQLHASVRLMVEKGAEIPPALLEPPARKPSDLRRGIILATSGLGLAIFLAALPGVRGAWGAGLTLFCIGVGHLIVWHLQRTKGPLSAELAPEL
ncbi:DUF6249 domain-containing protein [Hyalangium versicolor]|uniref:DUF6249 domain-containing protein n=1 Tax=Hyalangium versicolor TaxID=2861190 RepID=UPI001CD02541|nr:DUF6249 domain-containing protein [Hyalangium versicolor]